MTLLELVNRRRALLINLRDPNGVMSDPISPPATDQELAWLAQTIIRDGHDVWEYAPALCAEMQRRGMETPTF